MIMSNLAVLLAERRLNISKVSKDTNISRTTLTSLMHNYFNGIQMDTLNTLCLYLNVTPSDILAFIPYDFALENIKFDSTCDNCEFKLRVKTFSNDLLVNLVGEIWPVIKDADVFVCYLYPMDEEEQEDYKKLLGYYKSLPVSFKTELDNKICSVIDEIVSQYINGSVELVNFEDLEG